VLRRSSEGSEAAIYLAENVSERFAFWGQQLDFSENPIRIKSVGEARFRLIAAEEYSKLVSPFPTLPSEE